ncbi:hypothetical protein [Indibacter alkaliphilus]|uniref:hypothetical protein n=1 Tax=Indibacter alkaliphilus TaxID=579922 RepID=UPI001268D56D|nr:hypothetical protein [Indibacter alkaliphilus]
MRKSVKIILAGFVFSLCSLSLSSGESFMEDCPDCNTTMDSCEVSVDCGNGYQVTVTASTCSDALAGALLICAQM